MDKVQQQLKNSIIILSGKALHILVCGAFFFIALSEQKLMLEMSEDDIKSGRLISQDVMNKRNLEWLNGL